MRITIVIEKVGDEGVAITGESKYENGLSRLSHYIDMDKWDALKHPDVEVRNLAGEIAQSLVLMYEDYINSKPK